MKSTNKSKIKYCSKCGNLIDMDTKQCTVCRKQYVNKKSVLYFVIVSILLLACLSLGLTSLYLYNESEYWYRLYQEEQTESGEQYMPLFEDYTSLLSNKKTVDMYNVEVVNASDNKRYHVVGSNCWENDKYFGSDNSNSVQLKKVLIKRNGTEILTADYANEHGYHPCPKCFK